MSENAFSTKESFFILILLSGLVVAVIFAPLDFAQKFFPLTLILLVCVVYLYVLRLPRNLEGKNAKLEAKILEKLEGKKYNVYEENSLSWLYVCLLTTLKDTRPLFYNLIEERSLNPLAVYIRNCRRHLSPNWFCSTCGKQVRYAFKPIIDCVVDSLLIEDAGFLTSARIGCKDCDPFFSEMQKEEAILVG